MRVCNFIYYKLFDYYITFVLQKKNQSEFPLEKECLWQNKTKGVVTLKKSLIPMIKKKYDNGHVYDIEALS